MASASGSALPPGSVVHLSGIARSVKQAKLRQWLQARFGNVRHVRFVFHRSMPSHGHGFVQFADADTAGRFSKEYEETGFVFAGSSINVGPHPQRRAGEEEDFDDLPPLVVEGVDEGNDSGSLDSSGSSPGPTEAHISSQSSPREPLFAAQVAATQSPFVQQIRVPTAQVVVFPTATQATPVPLATACSAFPPLQVRQPAIPCAQPAPVLASIAPPTSVSAVPVLYYPQSAVPVVTAAAVPYAM